MHLAHHYAIVGANLAFALHLQGRDYEQGEHKVRPYTDWFC